MNPWQAGFFAESRSWKMTRGLEAYESFVGLPVFGGSGSVTIVSSTRSMMIVTSLT